jgi:hypothetical protein
MPVLSKIERTPRAQRKTEPYFSEFGVLYAFARVIFFASVSQISTDDLENIGLALRRKLREVNPQRLNSAIAKTSAFNCRYQSC